MAEEEEPTKEVQNEEASGDAEEGLDWGEEEAVAEKEPDTTTKEDEQQNEDGGLDWGDSDEENAVKDVFGSDHEEDGDNNRQTESEGTKVVFPLLPRPGDNDKLTYSRFPPNLRIEPAFFDPENFPALAKERRHEFASIRCKKDEDGGIVSNARFVRWSDNSVTLHVGKDVFSVTEDVLEHNAHHVFVQSRNVDSTDYSICHGTLTNKFLIKPVAVQGDDLHKKIMLQMDKTDKRVKVTTILQDPVADAERQIQMENERISRQGRTVGEKKRKKGKKISEFTIDSIEGGAGDYDDDDDDDENGRASEKKKYRAAKAKAGKGKRGKRKADSDESDAGSPPDSSSSESEAKQSSSSSSSDSSDAEIIVNKSRTQKKRVVESDSD